MQSSALAPSVWEQENGTQIPILYELLEKGADPKKSFYLAYPRSSIFVKRKKEKGYIEPAKVIAQKILTKPWTPFDEAQYSNLTLSEDFQKEIKPFIILLKANSRGRPNRPPGTSDMEETQGTVEGDCSDPVKSERKFRLRNLFKGGVRKG